jgi:amino acid transporter
MFWWGLTSLIALPFVGIFDESRWGALHGISAGIFFVGFMMYCWSLGDYMYKNRDKFPAEEQPAIQQTKNAVTTMLLITCGFGLAALLHGSKGITAIMEWATVLYFVNFFSIACYANPFYDCIHLPKTA